MTEATLSGAAALGADLGEQAALTGALLKQFSLDSAEAGRVNDVLAESAASSALDFGKLQTALPIVGATANAVGVDLERTTALLGTLSDRGLDASTSGTALRNVFLELSKKGLTMEQAMSKIRDSTDSAKTAMDLFGKRGATAGLILSQTEGDVDALETALKGADGAAQDMADTMLDNLAGDLTIANSAWEGFILSLEDGSSVFGKVSRGAVQAFTNILGGLTDLSNFEFNNFADGLDSYLTALTGIEIVLDDTVESTKELTEVEKENLALAKKRANLNKVKAKEEADLQAKIASELETKENEKDKKEKDRIQKSIDRKKAEAERIAADKIKHETDLQNQLKAIAVRTIEDDRAREEAALRLGFQQKIDAIEGSSELEKEVRFRLQEEMHQALANQRAGFAEEDAEKAKELAEIDNEAKVNDRAAQVELERLQAGEDLQLQREALESQRNLELENKELTEFEKQVIIKRFAEADAKLKQQQEINTLQMASDTFSQLSNLAQEGSDEAKALASAAALIQTYLGATAAYSAGMSIGGPVGLVLGPVMAGVAIATGLSNVAKINGVQFADGGVLQGDSHANGGIPFTIDGRSGFEAEGGEAIMTKKAVEMFGSELSAMNVAGGGVAFERGGSLRKFARGGGVPSSSGVTASQQALSSPNDMMSVADVIIDGFNDKEVINVSTNTTDSASEVINIQAEAEF